MTEDRARFEQRIGSVIGGYVLEGVVGSGGMGVVYRARQGETGRIVALKLMLPEIASNRRFRERFILEAQVAPDLDHPHIVPVFEVGDSAGELFIAMRLVEGVDLKHVVETEGPVEPKRALGLMRQAAAALDYAHERGVVHRDVKPQNFLLAQSDEGADHLYLTDFGLVKPTSTESTASRTTDVFGSIQYMSPEQIEDISIDGRADVYSLACVLYECLTGKPPFERSNEVAVLWAHVHEEPPRLTEVRPTVPGGLDLAVRQALSKHPDDRYLTCGEFVEALEDGAKQHRRQLVAPVMRPLVKRIPRPKTEREVWAPNFFPELSRVRKLTDRTNWVQVGAVTAVLMLLAAALVQFSYKGGVVQAVSDAGGVIGDTVSGLTEVASGGEDGSTAPASESRRKTSSRERRVAGFRTATARKSSADPQRQRAVAPAPPAKVPPGSEATGPTGSPGDPKVVFVASPRPYEDTELYVVPGSGGTISRLTTNEEDENWPDWSPDGTTLAYTRGVECCSIGSIWAMEADGTGARDLGICPRADCYAVEWSPNGRKIAFARGDRVFVATVSTRKVVRVRGLHGTGPSWSPDGDRLVDACQSDTWSMCVASLGTGRVIRSVAVGGQPARFAWSPNGDRIAFENARRIWTVRPNGTGLKQVSTTSTGFTYNKGDTEPTWSTDGEVIAYVSDGPRSDIVAMQADGSSPRRLINAELAEAEPDWWGPSS